VTLEVDVSKTNRLKFLIDTGAEISIVSGSSLKPATHCSLDKGINIKGISDTILKTGGTVELKLTMGPYETTHTFHVMEGNLQWQYDGILGRDFWEDKEANISYCDRKITMKDVVIEFDPKSENTNVPDKITLKARSENLMAVPTSSKGQGLISRK
jgi:hypothetical protein